MNPSKLIEEIDYGYFKTRTISNNISYKDAEEWDMECFSKKGWWVMPDVVVKVGDILTDDDDMVRGKQENDKSNDDNEEHDDDSCIRDDDENEIEQNRQMFLTWNEYVKKEQGYNGNEGGSIETWYYAAAIIISPCTDVTLS
jgi:hypothetical protein